LRYTHTVAYPISFRYVVTAKALVFHTLRLKTERYDDQDSGPYDFIALQASAMPASKKPQGADLAKKKKGKVQFKVLK
jgi:hypothetical protein